MHSLVSKLGKDAGPDHKLCFVHLQPSPEARTQQAVACRLQGALEVGFEWYSALELAR